MKPEVPSTPRSDPAPRVAGPAPERPSRRYRLGRGESAADGLRRVIAGRLEDALEQLRDRLAEDPVDAVHTARKDLKKARSALRMGRDRLPGKRFRLENDRLRDAGRLLSEARDADVRIATLEALRERYGEAMAAPAGRALDAAGRSAGARDGRSRSGELARAAERAAIAIEQARASAVELPLDRGGWRLIGLGIDRAYRCGRRGFRAVAADPSVEAVHELRKRVKDLWYQLRLLRDAWPSALDESADRAHELSELLGDHHDLALLAADLAPGAFGLTEPDRAELAGLIGRRQAELLRRGVPLGERMYAERPKAFERRMRAYWHAWRRG